MLSPAHALVLTCAHGVGRCWDRVEPYTAWGRDLAAAGHPGAAINCFTRAANAVQDERYGPHCLRMPRLSGSQARRMHARAFAPSLHVMIIALLSNALLKALALQSLTWCLLAILDPTLHLHCNYTNVECAAAALMLLRQVAWPWCGVL